MMIGFCGAVAGNCVCSMPADHGDEPHHCTNPTVFGDTPCNGRWKGDIDSVDFEIVTLPPGFDCLFPEDLR